MSKVVFVVGLPGSGKSTYINSHIIEDSIFIDDYKANANNHSSSFSDSIHYKELVDNLNAEIECFVIDIDFCDSLARAEAAQVLNSEIPGINIEWIFFENNPNRCRANVIKRNRVSLANDIAAITKYSSLYVIPSGVNQLPVP
jgi:predicted kinase